MKRTDRRDPTPIPLMRAQLAAYREGLAPDDLVEVTRRLFTPEAFADWYEGYQLSQASSPLVGAAARSAPAAP